MTAGEIVLTSFMTFWSAAIIALVWSTYRRIEHRIDRLEQRMDDQFGRIDDRFGRVDDRFGRLDAQIDDRFGRVEGQIDDRFGRVDAQIGSLRGDLTQIALAVGAGGAWRASEG